MIIVGGYFVVAEHEQPENNMNIECYDYKDMMKYARECEKQGYKVTTKVENHDES
jgi:hypothetical protein